MSAAGVIEEEERKNYFAPGSYVIGDVSFGTGCSVWFGAVIRGDEDSIEIGDNANIQDNCTLHTDPGFPLKIGRNCTLGHGCIVHGAILEDGCLVGMGAVIMNGAHIGRGSVIAASAVVKENMEVPPFSLVVGIPARVIRNNGPEALNATLVASEEYVRLAGKYAKHLITVSSGSPSGELVPSLATDHSSVEPQVVAAPASSLATSFVSGFLLGGALFSVRSHL